MLYVLNENDCVLNNYNSCTYYPEFTIDQFHILIVLLTAASHVHVVCVPGHPMGPIELCDYVGLDTTEFIIEGG